MAHFIITRKSSALKNYTKEIITQNPPPRVTINKLQDIFLFPHMHTHINFCVQDHIP